MDTSWIKDAVAQEVAEAKIIDLHTHLFPPAFGENMLWGVDELMTYHYLLAETFRYRGNPGEDFWALSKAEQADIIFQTLFVEHSPISESCRGVLTTLQKLGLDVGSRDLAAWRAYFAALTPEAYVDKVFEAAGVEKVVMTNDPFDDAERACWERGEAVDPRFLAALRLDMLILHYEENYSRLVAWGYGAKAAPDAQSDAEVRRFLGDWIERMHATYVAVSLPDTFRYPADDLLCHLIDACVVPVCAKYGIPFAMMIGVKRQVNPALKLAGDGVGKGDVDSVMRLCQRYPDNKFMATFLARENQHELAVTARKFANLHIFGCWWFLNNPSLIEEMTRMRIELLGLSVTPQHSDARVLDQLIYKWTHSRAVIAKVLADKYLDLAQTGWMPTREEIHRDVEALFGGEFLQFLHR
ncbi:MAG: glucuronate isomerase [Christensenellales bacterium]|jgi:hypothetical protein